MQNEMLREKLKPFTWGAQGTLPTASHFMVILARKEKSMRYDSDYISHMMFDVHDLSIESAERRRKYYEGFQKNDFKLLDNERAMFDWASKQTYIALGNMMTAAAMMGIDSCPIEGFITEDIEQIMRDEFDIDTEVFGVVVMVAFGYRTEAQGTKTRQTLEDTVQWYR